MIVKNAYYPHQLPTQIVIEATDGKFYAADLTPFRAVNETDLRPLAVFSPAMGDEIPDYTLKFYQLVREFEPRLKQRRINAGLTQKQLAEAAGVNIRQIQKIEAGEIQMGNVTLQNAARLAAALGVEIKDLL